MRKRRPPPHHRAGAAANAAALAKALGAATSPAQSAAPRRRSLIRSLLRPLFLLSTLGIVRFLGRSLGDRSRCCCHRDCCAGAHALMPCVTARSSASEWLSLSTRFSTSPQARDGRSRRAQAIPPICGRPRSQGFSPHPRCARDGTVNDRFVSEGLIAAEVDLGRPQGQRPRTKREARPSVRSRTRSPAS